jgi:hypothetical protein
MPNENESEMMVEALKWVEAVKEQLLAAKQRGLAKSGRFDMPFHVELIRAFEAMLDSLGIQRVLFFKGKVYFLPLLVSFVVCQSSNWGRL